MILLTATMKSMQFNIQKAVEVLETTPAVVDSMLRGKSREWLTTRIKPGTFSPADVLGHLIFGEQTDWIPRARIILEDGESRPFEPFDRFGYSVDGKSVDSMLDEFANARRENLDALAAMELDDKKLERTGTHPALGRVTLAQLLAAWVVHDLGHIAQITRVMANQYNEAVGPWREFLSIVR